MPLLDQTSMSLQWYSILNIGVPFSGKTRSLSTLYQYMVEKKQQCTNIYLFDLDGNSQSLEAQATKENWRGKLYVYRYTSRRGGKKIATSVAPARSTEEFTNFLEDFNQLYDHIDPRTGFWREDFLAKAPGAICIDSGTALEDFIYDFVLKMRGREFGEGDLITSGRDAGRTTKDVTGSDWASIKDKEIEVIEACKGLPCHFVYNCHELLIQEVVPGPQVRVEGAAIAPIPTGTVLSTPALTGNLRETIAKYFTCVLYSRREGNNATWQVTPGQRIKMAGSRLRDDLTGSVPQDYRKVLL